MDYERLVVNLEPDVKKAYRLWCAEHMEGDLSALIKMFVGIIADFRPGVDTIVEGMELIKEIAKVGAGEGET